MQKAVLLGRSREELEEFLAEMGEPSFRAQQLMQWIYEHREVNFEDMTNLPDGLRHRLDNEAQVCDIKIAQRVEDDEGTEKYALQMEDNELIESVLMRRNYGVSLCISTQVGCSMGCPFCASGMDGFIRNLSVSEILGQWFAIQRHLDQSDERISHIVVMGSGEPLNNYENVVDALKFLHSEDGPGISYRRMTLSTVGLIKRIKHLKEENIPITLALSLHAPNDYLRDRLVPINRDNPLSDLIPVCQEYAEKTGRRVSFEYAMIKDVNDFPELARELGILLEDILCHVNLIPFNPIGDSDYEASDDDTIEEFAEVLSKMGIQVTVRNSMGLNIDAGCGQLRRRLALKTSKNGEE